MGISSFKKTSLLFIALFYMTIQSCDLFSPGLGETVDITPPVLTITSPVNNPMEYKNSSFDITGSVSDDISLSSVLVEWPGGSKTAQVNGNSWTANITPAEVGVRGTVLFTATAYDTAGKASSPYNVNVVIDDKDPTVIINSPQSYPQDAGDDPPLYSSYIVIEGDVWDPSPIVDVTVDVFDSTDTLITSRTAEGTNSWYVRVEFDGAFTNNEDYYYEVTATDQAGNYNTYVYHSADIWEHITGDDLFPTPSALGLWDQDGVDLSLTDPDDITKFNDDRSAMQKSVGVSGGGDLSFTYNSDNNTPKISLSNLDAAQAVELNSLGPNVPIYAYATDNQEGINPGSISLSVFSFLSTDPADLIFTLEDSGYNAPGDGLYASFRFDLTGDNILDSGKYTGVITLTDQGGTPASLTFSFLVNKGAPSIISMTPSSTYAGTEADGSFISQVVIKDDNPDAVLEVEARETGGTVIPGVTAAVLVAETEVNDGNETYYTSTWQGVVPKPVPDELVLTVTVTDSSGLKNARTQNLTMDRDNPTLSITVPGAGDFISGNALTAAGTADDGADGSNVYQVFVGLAEGTLDAGSVPVGQTWNAAEGNTSWSLPLDLSVYTEGAFTLFAYPVDVANNQGDMEYVNFNFDLAPPTLTLDGGTADEIISGDYTLQGSISDSNGITSFDIIRAYDGGAPASMPGYPMTIFPDDKDHDWSLDNTVSGDGSDDGIYDYKFVVVDHAGKTVELEKRITVDTQPPGLTISNLDEGDLISTSSYLIKGFVSDSSGVQSLEYTLNSESSWTAVSVANTGNWSLEISGLIEGSDNTITFRAADTIGLSMTLPEITFAQDLSVPDLAIDGTDLAAYENQYVNSGFILNGTASDENGITRLDISIDGGATWTQMKDSSDEVYASSDNSEINWNSLIEVPADGSGDGSHLVMVEATDLFGRVSTQSFLLYMDASIPTLTVINLVDDQLLTSSPYSVSGTWSDNGGSGTAAADGAYIEYKLDSDSGWTAFTSDQSAWFGEVTFPQGQDQILSIHAYDAKGNMAVDQITGIDVDTELPLLTETALPDSDWRERSSGITFEGTAYDSNELASLTVEINGNPPEAVAVESDGSWEYIKDDTEGSFAFVFTATDVAGRSSSLSRNISIDTTAPVIVPAASISGYVDNNIAISGTANDPGTGASGVVLVEYSIDGTNWPDLNGTTEWSGNIDTSALAEGSLDIRFRATDAGGRISDEVIRTISIDHEAPRAEINVSGSLVDISGEVSTREAFTLSGTADDDAYNTIDTTVKAAATAVLSYTRNGGNETDVALAPLTDGSWSWNSDAAITDGNHDGLYVFTLTVTDDPGKTSIIQQVVNIDTTAPTLSVSSPVENEAVDDATLSISGTSRDTGGVGFDGTEDVEYSLDDSLWHPLSLNGTSWSEEIPLAEEGSKMLYVRSTDAVGNQVSDTITYYYDLSAPILTETGINSTDTLFLNDDYALLQGSWSESNELKSITIEYEDEDGAHTTLYYLDSSAFAADPSDISGSWGPVLIDVDTENSGTGLSDGSYEFTIIATDAAERTAVLTRYIHIDTIDPALTSAPVASDWYSTANISIGGTAEDTDGSGIDSVEYCLVEDGTYDDEDWNLFSGTTSFGSTVRMNNGATLILLRCTDRAGNVYSQTEATGQTVNVDTLEPVVSFDSSGSGQQISRNEDFDVLINYSDEHSGIQRVELSLDSDFAAGSIEDSAVLPPLSMAGSLSLSLPEASLDTLSAGSNTLYVRGVDNAGNYSTLSSLNFNVDIDPPDGQFSFYEDGSVINRTLDFSGTASDDNGISAIGDFEIFNSNTAFWEDISGVAVSGTYNWSIVGFDSLAYYNSDYDSDPGTDGIQYDLRLELFDDAGNTGYAAITLTADQDTDRPVVKLNNLTLENMASDNFIWLKQANVIYGTVTDDDGVEKLEISTNGGSDWAEIDVSNGAWTYGLEDDGAYTMLFRVTDSESALFTASVTDEYSLSTPKLMDSEDNYYGYEDTSDLATALYVTVDTQNPDVTSAEYWDSDALVWSTAISSRTFGGTTGSFLLRQYCYDANNIEEVEVTIEEKVGDAPGAVYRYTALSGTDTDIINGNEYTAHEANIDVSTLASGSRSLNITVTDKADLTTKSTLSLIIDNTAPTLNLDSHNDNDQVSGSVTLKGSSGGSAVELLYKVTTSASVPTDWTVPTDVNTGDPDYTQLGAHQVLSALSSWRINFDDDINNLDGFTHDRTLKRYIVALSSGTLELNGDGSVVYSGTETKYTDIITLYFHFRATDAFGNYDDTISHALKVDPQGDIPIVNMTYPAVSSYGWHNSGSAYGTVYTENENPSIGDGVYSDITMNTLLGTLTDYDSGARTVSVSFDALDYSSHGGDVIQGGILRIQGTAEDDKSITGIYLQIDPTYDAAVGFQWDNTSAAAAGAELLPDGSASLDDKYTIEELVGGLGQYGIKVGDSISWSYTLNRDGEFNGLGGGNNQIALRLLAVDEDDNISSFDIINDCVITIDSAAPLIGSSEPLYLYQYENNAFGTGDVVASKEYNDGMWLNGKWWLCGSVEDENGISSVTMNAEDLQLTADSWTGTSGYQIRALIGSDEADAFGTLSYNLTAIDNDTVARTTNKIICLNFDNKAPVLLADSDESFDIDSKVVQSNGFYSLGSEVSEDSSFTASQSGFSRVALFFLRRGTSTKAVYDTWYDKSDSANELDYTSSDLVYDSGLYWMSENVSRSGNLMELTLGTENANIHTGGLVKMGGAYYTVTSVSGTTVIIDGSPAVTEDTAYFAVAQIVDHQLTESNGSVLGANGYYTDVINDDDDCMVESVTIQGGSAAWEANINSRNIPDGPIEIHYVAFDEAGNYSIGIVGGVAQGSYAGEDAAEVSLYTYNAETKVANNAPRLAAVWFGTDDDGNGSVDPDELTGDLFGVDRTGSYDPASSGEYDADMLKESYTMNGGNSLMTIKGDVSIIPEIVGGNGNLFYDYDVTLSGASDPYYIVNVDAGSVWASGTDYSGSGDDSEILDTASIELTLEDFLSAGDVGTEIVDAANQTFCFTFWDSTDESTPGVDSQRASLSMVMDVALRDTTPPEVSIDPFYWNSETDCSTSGLNGHIELADSDGRTTPAISGTVEMTGTVSDNQLVNDIYVTIPGWNGGNAILAASYISNSLDSGFAANPGLPAGVTFSAETTSLNNSGHEVSWSMVWDSSTVGSKAAEDLEITLAASDRGSPALNIGVITYTPNSDSGSTNLDVVPYIVKVETSLASLKSNNWSVYNRTARGHYPVREDEVISVYGYNLSGAQLDDGTVLAVTNDGTYDVAAVDMADIATSGELTLEVSGVPTLNNSNDNGEGYNLQPNGDNNNLLNDDVILDIWEINSEAAAPVSGMIEQPVMKIHPTNGRIGFAFVNGPLYFSMGNSTYSAQYWMGSYDFFTSVGFAFDKLGYSYGVAAGGDINSTSADKFQFMTSRWGIANTEQSGSYGNYNSLRLESIGQKDSDGTRIFNKQRIKSPSITSAVHGSVTNLYLAYYDDINEEIRFKAGSTSSNNRTNFGSFVDYDTAGDPYPYRNAYVSMIAGSDTGNNAGEYVSIAVVSAEGAIVDDVVVAVWYDAINRCLWYTYNDTPLTNRNGVTDGTGWVSPERVFPADSDMANAGEYCQIVADKSGGIHIAAYDPMNLDLVYAHYDSYSDATAETCIVDGYGVVGSNITLDVALSSDSKWIPYIGYYATSCVKPKSAYKINTASDAPAGSVDEAYTGDWEISVLPTDSTLTMGSLGNNKINIGVWKNQDTWALEASGDIQIGTNSSSHIGSSYGATCWDIAYGNGMPNPVLGYAVKNGSRGFIETAQMK